ncbi:hypothetical protein Tco_0796813 [Tanacetum coccineum]
MVLYIQGKDNGRIIFNSVENGPLVWPTVALENNIVRSKTFEELSNKEKLQAICDLKATNIVLQGLPPDVYALVNHHKVSKDIWDRVKLLMQGTSLSKQERECKLYDEFDKFSYVKGETLHQHYLYLPLEWGKFVTDVKLAKDLNTSNYDQLYAYLEQHEVHANETCLMRKRFPDPLALVANYHQQASHFNNYHSQYITPQYQQQLSPPTQHVYSSLPYYVYTTLSLNQQSTINSNLLPIRGIKPLLKMIESLFSKFTEDKVKILSVQVHKGMLQVQGEIHQVKQRLSSVIIDKAEGKELDEEQLAFLTDHGVADGQVAHTITHNAAFQTDDLDAYDFDCDDISSAKAVLMANLSSCDSNVLSEVPYFDTSQNDMMNQSVHEFQYSKLSPIVNYPDDEITSNSNIILYSQYLEETSNSELDRYKERVKILKQRFNVDLSDHEKFIDSQVNDMIRMKNTKFAAFETEIYTLKQTLSKHIEEKDLMVLKRNSKKENLNLLTKRLFWKTKIKN